MHIRLVHIRLGDATVFSVIPTDFPATHHNRFQQGRRKKSREPSQNATKIKFFSSFLGGYCYWAPILWAPKMIVLLYMIVNTIVIFFLFIRIRIFLHLLFLDAYFFERLPTPMDAFLWTPKLENTKLSEKSE